MGRHTDFVFKKYNITENLQLLGTILFYLILIGLIIYGVYFIATYIMTLIQSASESGIVSQIFSSEAGTPSLLLMMLIIPIPFMLAIRVLGLFGGRGDYGLF